MELPMVNSSKNRLVRDYSTDSMFMQSPAPRSSSIGEHRDFRDFRDNAERREMSGHRSARTQPSYPTSPMEDIPSPQIERDDPRRMDFNLDPIDEYSLYAPSVSTQQTTMSNTSGSKLADFFGLEVYNVILRNPTTRYQLRKFAETRLCGENLDFLDKVDSYQHSLNGVTTTIFEIHRNFISSSAPNQLNLPEDVLLQINKNLKSLLAKTIPSMESVFVTAQNDIEKLVSSDIYPRFVRHQMTVSATKALSSNRNKYAGLGDCFCLTSPALADNPIVFASDGFVKVTGYTRNEIIPRNCRFLQTRHTDRTSVARIKKNIETPREHVELLLNERKTGEPFWNLLYTAPLYDQNGKLAFFIGGQINVSTTIHNTSDILRILSYNADEAIEKPEENTLTTNNNKANRNTFFGSWRSKSKQQSVRTPGMENDLLEDLNHMSFKQQKDAFYSAYSKYIVINAENMVISFYSVGITSTLCPSQGGQRIPPAGMEVLKFLTNYSPNGLSRDFKSRVRAALKAGQAISVDLVLCVQRWTVTEKFTLHWTPMKDAEGKSGYIVLTLGSSQDLKG